MAKGSPQEVHTDVGDDMSDMFYQATILTRENRPDSLDLSGDSFAGTALIRGSYFAKHINELSFGHELDGIGTKVEVDERMNDHFGSAQNLFAMIGDDVAVRNGEIITIDTVLDVRELDSENEQIMNGMRQLAQGMVFAASLSGAVVQTGEIAELGRRIHGYGDFNYNWCGVAFFAVHHDRMLTGRQLAAGQALVGLVEPGFRSNGMTDVRNALREQYGREWHRKVEPELGNMSLGTLVQRPAVIYAKLMREVSGGFNRDVEAKAPIGGVAHITGGGQPSKLGRMLRQASGLGVVIDKPIDPPAMMLHVQRLRGFSDRRAYGKWHMGPGMVVATADPDAVIREAGVHGIGAQLIGEVTNTPVIRIKNRGAVRDKKWLEFPVHKAAA